MKITGQISKWFSRYKLALLVLAAGLCLLLWPGGDKGGTTRSGVNAPENSFDIEKMEEKLARSLSRIEGAGEVSVVLSVRESVEQLYARDSARKGEDSREEKTVVISTGSGTEEVVPVQQRYPAFQGAVVVCQGGQNAQVRLLITQAVSALTGLGADKISVCPAKSTEQP